MGIPFHIFWVYEMKRRNGRDLSEENVFLMGILKVLAKARGNGMESLSE